MEHAPPESPPPTLQGEAHKLIHAINAIVILIDRECRIVDCNAMCETVSGFTSGQLIGRDIAQALAGSDEAAFLKGRVLDIAAGEEVGRFDSFLVTELGHRRRVRWNGVRLKPGKGPSAVLLTAIDVTDEYEALARASELAEENTCLQESLSRICVQYDLEAEEAAERRSEERHDFPRSQRVAAIDHDRMPAASDFFSVECRNIGARGIGFLLDSPPRSATYVVELGGPRQGIYLTAKVQHATIHPTSGQFLVGCTYTGRVSLAGIHQPSPGTAS